MKKNLKKSKRRNGKTNRKEKFKMKSMGILQIGTDRCRWMKNMMFLKKKKNGKLFLNFQHKCLLKLKKMLFWKKW